MRLLSIRRLAAAPSVAAAQCACLTQAARHHAGVVP